MKSYINILVTAAILLTAAGCEKQTDDFRDRLSKKEIVYPGIISRFKATPGNNRILLTWNPSPDPSVNKYVVYWNDKNDSLVVNANSHNTSDVIKCYIENLGEYTYTFSLVSFDDKGNKSIETTSKRVKVFGPLYASGLVNRPYRNDNPSTFNGESVTLNFNVPDTVNVTTEIKYTALDGKEKKVFLDPKDASITLPDYKVGQPILYRSSYLPITGAIDTFYTSKYDKFPVTKDVTSNYLKNAVNPIQPLETDVGNRFRSPADWIVNNAVKNKTGSSSFGSKMGGWGSDQGGCFLITTESGEADIINGKMYQTLKLPAGSYTIKIDLVAGEYGSNPSLIVAAPGNSLPDLKGNVPATATLGYADLKNKEFSFVLEQETTVSLGFLFNNPQNSYWIIKGMSLVAKY